MKINAINYGFGQRNIYSTNKNSKRVELNHQQTKNSVSFKGGKGSWLGALGGATLLTIATGGLAGIGALACAAAVGSIVGDTLEEDRKTFMGDDEDSKKDK